MTIRLVHEEAISPDPLYQGREPDWFFGRCVKIAFESPDGMVEWMWVQVLNIDGDTLSGNLVCNPIFCTHLDYGDPITLSRLQIAAVDLTLKEWWDEVEELKAKYDCYNRFLGIPSRDNGFANFFDESFTPRQALRRWYGWQPSENEPLQFLTDLANRRAD
jgi:hypothetical protein